MDFWWQTSGVCLMEMMRSTVEKICCYTCEEQEKLSKDHSCQERRVCKEAEGSPKQLCWGCLSAQHQPPCTQPDTAGAGDSHSSVLGTVPLWQEWPVQHSAHCATALQLCTLNTGIQITVQLFTNICCCSATLLRPL